MRAWDLPPRLLFPRLAPAPQSLGRQQRPNERKMKEETREGASARVMPDKALAHPLPSWVPPCSPRACCSGAWALCTSRAHAFAQTYPAGDDTSVLAQRLGTTFVLLHVALWRFWTANSLTSRVSARASPGPGVSQAPAWRLRAPVLYKARVCLSLGARAPLSR